MAKESRLLLEGSSTDGYRLENGSGVLLREPLVNLADWHSTDQRPGRLWLARRRLREEQGEEPIVALPRRA